jgi:ferredoxin-nitrate reductase
VPSLLKYKELNFCEIHSADADMLGIKEGDEIRVASKRGSLITKALITECIREKTIFIPISNREVNYLTNDLLDKESFQPDYNHSAVKIERLYKK